MRTLIKMVLLSGVILLAYIGLCGCSGNDANLTAPAEITKPFPTVNERPSQSNSLHSLWGLWEFAADPVNQTLDIIPIRVADFHLNSLHFLEPPPFEWLTIEDGPYFNGDLLELDIGIRHPFMGLTEFTGFDVCGIVITEGTLTGYGDGIVMAGPGDTRLLNVDGYSRWWNPDEFPKNDGTPFCYKDGLLGAPDSFANYNCNVNGYKYFADSLSKDDPMNQLNLSDRGMFGAGMKNIRHYTLELGSAGLIFNYAVDASWEPPTGSPPWEVPDDFPEDANRPEPYRISVTVVENNLYYLDIGDKGGTAQLLVNAYDWFNADQNTLSCRSICGIPPVTDIVPLNNTPDYATFQVDLDGSSLTQSGETELLMICQSEQDGYQGFLPGEEESSYFTFPILISPEEPVYIEVTSPDGGEEWIAGSEEEITWDSHNVSGTVFMEFSRDDFVDDIHPIATDEENDGTFLWYVPCYLSNTLRVRIGSTDNPEIDDESDDYFSIINEGDPESPMDITPPGLSFTAYDFGTIDNYLYISSGGLKVFDVEVPASPYELKTVSGAGYPWGIAVAPGYVYLAEYMGNFLEIIDIDPLEDAHVVKSVKASVNAASVAVSNGYAYVADYSGYKLFIIDVEPPESASVVKYFDTIGSARDVYISGDYAYVVSTGRFYIIDISTPESASIVNTLNPSGFSYGVHASDGYAYIANQGNGLIIYDVDPPESANVVNIVAVPGIAHGVDVSDGYAYIASRPLPLSDPPQAGGLRIVDVDPVGSAHLVSSVDTPGTAMNVTALCSYAFIADVGGLRVIKLW